MKLTINSIILLGVWLFSSVPSMAQFNTITYISNGYFNGLDLSDSLMIKDDFVITITQKEVEILDVDVEDKSKDSVFIKRRTMSALKYATMAGEDYYVWKLGDRKMVLRKLGSARYLSVFKTDEYGLPEEYITFKIKD